MSRGFTAAGSSSSPSSPGACDELSMCGGRGAQLYSPCVVLPWKVKLDQNVATFVFWEMTREGKKKNGVGVGGRGGGLRA